MPSPNTVFTELVSTTFRKHAKEIKDNVSKNNALLRRIYDKGNVRREDGGLTIVAPLAVHCEWRARAHTGAGRSR